MKYKKKRESFYSAGCMWVCCAVLSLQLSVCPRWRNCVPQGDMHTPRFMVAMGGMHALVESLPPFTLSTAPTIRAGELGCY